MTCECPDHHQHTPWVALVDFLLLGELVPVLPLNHWLLDFSPFAHVPRMPGGTLTGAPSLPAVAALLMTGGLTGFCRRGVGIT